MLRLIYLYKLEIKDVALFEHAIVDTLQSSTLPVLTLTADNGSEFGNHENFVDAMGAEYYLAHPYSSWVRGANESSNGLVRRYLPKDSDFTGIKQMDLKRVLKRLTNRPG